MKAHNTDDIDCSECKAYYFVLLLWSLDNYPGTDLLIERSPVSLSSLLKSELCLMIPSLLCNAVPPFSFDLENGKLKRPSKTVQ